MNKGDLINKVQEGAGLVSGRGDVENSALLDILEQVDPIIIVDVIEILAKMDYDAIDGAPEEKAIIILDTLMDSYRLDPIIIEEIIVSLVEHMDYDAIDGAPEEKG